MAERALAVKTNEIKKENSIPQIRRAEYSPSAGSPVESILFLQRTIGNQAVQRFMKSGALQAKLKIGAPGDSSEQEADRVAEQVMRMPQPRVSEVENPGRTMGNPVQRQCPRCTKKSGKEEEEIQAKEAEGKTPVVSQEVENSISTLRGGGQPLPESVRAFYEPRFGQDFIPKPVGGRSDGGIFATVYFGQNNFLLEGYNFEAVEKLSEELRYMPDSTIIVDGHASKEGTVEYNLGLSEKRRFAAIAILGSKLIGTAHFIGKAYGESKSAVEETGKTATDRERQRAQNRRAEIMIIPVSALKPKKPISFTMPMEIKPETPEERVERILKEKPPAPPPKHSFSEMFWKKFDESVEDILSKTGVPIKYRGYIKKGARAAVKKGAEKALDEALDKAYLKGDAKRAIKEAIKAAAEIKF